jgi:hypothetical protein
MMISDNHMMNNNKKSDNDKLKSHLSKFISEYKNLQDIKKVLENVYNKNKENTKVEKELEKCNEEIKCKLKNIEEFNNMINHNNTIQNYISTHNNNVKNKEPESNKRVKQMTDIQKEALSIFTKKNHDYGDSFATYGPVGVIVRIGDKIQRLQSITKKGITMVNDESMRDTLMDLHNYCAMAVMLMDEDKEKEKEKEKENEKIVINEPGMGTYNVGDLTK